MAEPQAPLYTLADCAIDGSLIEALKKLPAATDGPLKALNLAVEDGSLIEALKAVKRNEPPIVCLATALNDGSLVKTLSNLPGGGLDQAPIRALLESANDGSLSIAIEDGALVTPQSPGGFSRMLERSMSTPKSTLNLTNSVPNEVKEELTMTTTVEAPARHRPPQRSDSAAPLPSISPGALQ